MSKPAFTPGPWSHDGVDVVFAVAPQCCNRPIQHPNFDAGGNPTTIAYEECCGSPEPEQIPVAACGTNDLDLIAAAPDMYAALEKIVEMNVQYAKDRYGDASRADEMACVRAARAALKKARGEQ